jgi:acetyltransferase-like isoleucine patch superfamily enzyme
VITHDDFTKIIGGKRVSIGRYNHLASFCAIIGGGEFITDDFVAISCACQFITGTDDYSGKSMTGPTVPIEFRPAATRSKIIIKKHTVLGTNTIVHPGVTINEGVATGSLTLVTKNLDPWTIYLGVPARKYAQRPKEHILKMEKELLKKYD